MRVWNAAGCLWRCWATSSRETPMFTADPASMNDRLPRTASRTPAFLEYAYMALGDEFLTVWGYLSQVGSHRLLIRPAQHAATRAVLAAPRPWLARTRSGTGRGPARTACPGTPPGRPPC